MLAAVLSSDFRKCEVVKEGLNENSLKGVVALHQVQDQKDAAAAFPKLVKQGCSSEFTFFLEEQKGPLFSEEKMRLKKNEGMKRLKAKKEKEKKRERSERKKGRKKERS